MCLFLPKFGCHGNSLGSLKISDSIFNFADPENLTIRVKNSSILLRRTEIGAIFCLFLPKFCCHGNSLESLKISDNMFEIAVPEDPTLHEKLLSISCTQMNLCLFESLAYLYHCGNSLSVDFFVINCGNYIDFLIISQMGTRVHSSTSDEPLTTFLQ